MKTQVLLVEDDELCQEIVAEFLSEIDVEVCVAGDGKEALELLQKRHFDVVLMDIMMPNMDGVEATIKIRALLNKSAANVPIIAVTARNPDTDQDLWFVSGINDFVAKPFSEEDLLAVVKRYI